MKSLRELGLLVLEVLKKLTYQLIKKQIIISALILNHI